MSKLKTYTFDVQIVEHGRLDIDAESFEQAKEMVENAKDDGYDLSNSSSMWSYDYSYTDTHVDYNAYLEDA